MLSDEVHPDTHEYGYFIDLETNFYVIEKLDEHPHSDADLRPTSTLLEQPHVTTMFYLHFAYISVIYLMCMYHLLTR
uniref:Uncharacterized protein n=1 Tax=viral metagenome TaxID=1070528 RepID=A0A6C0JHH3_9ZZZZ